MGWKISPRNPPGRTHPDRTRPGYAYGSLTHTGGVRGIEAPDHLSDGSIDILRSKDIDSIDGDIARIPGEKYPPIIDGPQHAAPEPREIPREPPSSKGSPLAGPTSSARDGEKLARNGRTATLQAFPVPGTATPRRAEARHTRGKTRLSRRPDVLRHSWTVLEVGRRAGRKCDPNSFRGRQTPPSPGSCTRRQESKLRTKGKRKAQILCKSLNRCVCTGPCNAAVDRPRAADARTRPAAVHPNRSNSLAD